MKNLLLKKTIDFPKVAYWGKRKIHAVSIDIEIRIKENAVCWETLQPLTNVYELSICGSIWNNLKTDIVCGGQCIDTILKLTRSKKCRKIFDIWTAYHLNDLNAGTKKQTEFIRSAEAMGWKYEYNEACVLLKNAGLYEDMGFKYGHGWLYGAIPSEIIEELKSL